MNASACSGITDYFDLRQRALHYLAHAASNAPIHAVVMDWTSASGTATVIAGADGIASIYLSDGTTFVDGSNRNPALRSLATRIVQSALPLRSLATPATTTMLPAQGELVFYLVAAATLQRVTASEAAVRSTQHPLHALAVAFRQLVEAYRHANPTHHLGATFFDAMAHPAAIEDDIASASSDASRGLWSKDDHFGRGVQAVCGLLLLAAGCAALYFDWYRRFVPRHTSGLAFVFLVLSARCLWYAVSGKNNVNRDNF